jgi:FixJ family two-component response regulator
VEDDESVRNALSSFFRSLGFRCAVFASSEAFLDSGKLSETDCVILDVGCPARAASICAEGSWRRTAGCR